MKILLVILLQKGCLIGRKKATLDGNATINISNGAGAFEIITLTTKTPHFAAPAKPSLLYTHVQDITVSLKKGSISTNNPENVFYRIYAKSTDGRETFYIDTMTYNNLEGTQSHTIGTVGTKEQGGSKDKLTPGTTYNITAQLMEQYWDADGKMNTIVVSDESTALSVTTMSDGVPADIQIMDVSSKSGSSIDEVSIPNATGFKWIKPGYGDVITTKVKVLNHDGNSMPNQQVTWSASSSAITINSAKVTTTDAYGICEVIYTVNANKGTCEVSAITQKGAQKAAVRVTIKAYEQNLRLRNATTSDLYTGQTRYITFVEYSAGTSEKSVTWAQSSSNSGEVEIIDNNSDDLIIKGKTAGTVTLTATAAGGKSTASVTIIVKPGIQKMEFTEDDGSTAHRIAPGVNFELKVNLNDGDITQTEQNVIFKLQNAVAGVSIQKSAGKYYLTVSRSIKQESLQATVIAAANDYGSNQNTGSGRMAFITYSIDQKLSTLNSMSLAAGTNGTLRTYDTAENSFDTLSAGEQKMEGSYLIVKDSEGNQISAEELTYTVRNTSVLTVDEDGMIHVTGSGITRIKAETTDGTHRTLTVSLRVTPNATAVLSGTMAKKKATTASQEENGQETAEAVSLPQTIAQTDTTGAAASANEPQKQTQSASGADKQSAAATGTQSVTAAGTQPVTAAQSTANTSAVAVYEEVQGVTSELLGNSSDEIILQKVLRLSLQSAQR